MSLIFTDPWISVPGPIRLLRQFQGNSNFLIGFQLLNNGYISAEKPSFLSSLAKTEKHKRPQAGLHLLVAANGWFWRWLTAEARLCVHEPPHSGPPHSLSPVPPSGAVGGRCVYSPCLITLWKMWDLPSVQSTSEGYSLGAHVQELFSVIWDCRGKNTPPRELRARRKDEVNSQGWVHSTGRHWGSDAHAWQGTWLFWASWQISISFSFLLKLWKNLLMHNFTKDDIWRGWRGYVRGLHMLGFPF